MPHFSREHLSSSRQKCGGGGGVFYLVRGVACLCVWWGRVGGGVVRGVKGQGPAYLGHHWLSVSVHRSVSSLHVLKQPQKDCSCVWIVVRLTLWLTSAVCYYPGSERCPRVLLWPRRGPLGWQRQAGTGWLLQQKSTVRSYFCLLLTQSISGLCHQKISVSK